MTTEIKPGDQYAINMCGYRRAASWRRLTVARVTAKQVVMTNDSRWWKPKPNARDPSALNKVGGRNAAVPWTEEHTEAAEYEERGHEARRIVDELEDLRHDEDTCTALLPELRIVKARLDALRAAAKDPS